MWRRVRQILDNLPEGKDRSPGWYLRWHDKFREIFREERAKEKAALEAERERRILAQHHLVEQESKMSYTLQAGEVYQLARSLRREDVFALPPGVFEPQVVEVDEETAGQMTFAGVLLYLDGQSVAVFTHPDDKAFVLGMVVDPNAEPQVEEVEVTSSAGAAQEEPIEEPGEPVEPTVEAPSTPGPATPEQLAEWGYAENQICEACGYYIHDHPFDGENLACIDETVTAAG